ncbi:predicted protein [Nematostella vectensis]|uniref:Uncharacterized protein n=1 Tax=Nematostella vectensis TaxID=45351 RepID=A7S203_NEMVE|nr:predicted protein [Nematostella vectensis]|eukprot:XP_001634354.1 predicted protein [Nematostella vectensis]
MKVLLLSLLVGLVAAKSLDFQDDEFLDEVLDSFMREKDEDPTSGPDHSGGIPTAGSSITNHPTSEPNPTNHPTGEPNPTNHPTGEPHPSNHPTSEPHPSNHPTGEPHPTNHPTDGSHGSHCERGAGKFLGEKFLELLKKSTKDVRPDDHPDIKYKEPGERFVEKLLQVRKAVLEAAKPGLELVHLMINDTMAPYVNITVKTFKEAAEFVKQAMKYGEVMKNFYTDMIAELINLSVHMHNHEAAVQRAGAGVLSMARRQLKAHAALASSDKQCSSHGPN